jgi:hypothetical protein
MNNPAPRPALRKAQDATVHPAAPSPVSSAATHAAAAAPVVDDAAPTSRKRSVVPMTSAPATRRRFAGRTSDHLRAESDLPVETTADATGPTGAGPADDDGRRSRKDTQASDRHSGTKHADTKHAKTKHSDTRQPQAERSGDTSTKQARAGSAAADERPTLPSGPVGAELMKGKAVELDVAVPKRLRKAAKERAGAEGLDLDTVVVDLLHGWVTRPR